MILYLYELKDSHLICERWFSVNCCLEGRSANLCWCVFLGQLIQKGKVSVILGCDHEEDGVLHFLDQSVRKKTHQRRMAEVPSARLGAKSTFTGDCVMGDLLNSYKFKINLIKVCFKDWLT